MSKFFYGVFVGFMLSCGLDLAIKDIEKNDRLGLQQAQREAEERLIERQKNYQHQFKRPQCPYKNGIFNPPEDKET